MMPNRRTMLTLATTAVLPGCSWYHAVFPRTVELRWIEFRVVERANGNKPIAIDLVHLSERELLTAEVAKMTAEEWFTRKAQIRRDFPGEVDIQSWELVPGQLVPRARLPRPRVNRAGFLFARYAAPGAYRHRFTPDDDDVSVTLDADEFGVTSL